MNIDAIQPSLVFYGLLEHPVRKLLELLGNPSAHPQPSLHVIPFANHNVSNHVAEAMNYDISRQVMHKVSHYIVAFDLQRFQFLPHPDALPVILRF